MKKLLLLALVLNLCFFVEGEAQSQMPSRKRPAFSPHSKRTRFAKSPHSGHKQMEGDSSLQEERLRILLPPHLRGMKNLPPQILAERRWLLQGETEGTSTGAAGLEPNDPFNRFYPPHKRALAQMPSPSKAGAPQILSGGVQEAWVARYGEPGHANDIAAAMVIDGAGNIYVTGYSESDGSPSDYVTVKYNAAGVRQWTARYNGPGNGDDRPVAIAVDPADGGSNVYVTGNSGTVKYNSAGTQEWVAAGSGSALAVDGTGNVYVTGINGTVKYNSAGTQEWVATGWGSALAVDGTGNVYVTGRSWNDTNADYATVKYNSAGQEQWVARYNGPRDGDDCAVALAVEGIGNVYVTGYSKGLNGGNPNYATIKYNSAGAQKWVRIYNGPGNGDDYAVALAVDGTGNVYVTGSSVGLGTGHDYATVKYNSSGQQQWAARYNGRSDVASALAVDGVGNVYVTGTSEYYSSDYVTVKYNSVGTQEWVATYNGPGNDHDYVVALAVDGTGNVYVTGSSVDFGTASDYSTVKYDAFGVEQWVAHHDELGGNSSHDIAAAMAIDGSGNVYVTGYSESFYSPPYNESFYSSHYLTVKYDAAGVQQWTARYNGPNHWENYAVAIAVDGVGNVYVTGGSGDYPYFNYATLKYNAAGTQQWVATYHGDSENYPVALAVDGAGNVYVTGSSGTYGYEVGNYDYATVKYNAVGTQEWVKTYDGGSVFCCWNNHPVALAVDGAGNVYVAGYSGEIYRDGEDEYIMYDYVTVKYDAAGTEKWVKTYNGSGNEDDFARALGIDAAGNVYVTGSSWNGTSYDFATVKYNSAGTQEWVAAHSAQQQFWYYGPNGLHVDAVSNIYVTGSSWNGTNDDYVTIKYNATGTQEWVATYNGPSNGWDTANALAVDGAGNVYVTGSSGGDYATTKYNSTGQEQWVARYNGPGNGVDAASTLAVDGHGNVYVTGSSVGSGTGYDFATIKYTQNPIADAGQGRTICAGGSVQIGGSPTGAGGLGGPYTLSWSPATGLDNPTAPNPMASPVITTTYTVTVTETATGAFAKDDVTVTIRATGWSVAHIVDVDDVIFGINQSAATPPGATPRDIRGLALSPDERFLYLGYTAAPNRRLVRKIDLSVSPTGAADPAHNHSAVVAQLKLPSGTQPARDIATDDKGRVYLALGTKIEVYNSNLQTPVLHTLSGFTACEGVATRRENGALVVYATDRLDKTLERFVLIEGTGETITSSNKTGLDGDGEVRIIGVSSPRGLDIASNGTAWIADASRGKVYRVNPAGQTVDSAGVAKAWDVAIDETRGEVYVSQYTLRTLKVLNLSNGKSKRRLTPPAVDLNVDLDGADGTGALSGIDVASCQRVFVANERGRSILTGNPPDSPFSNVGDNNDVKAADADPVLVVTGSGIAKEPEVSESEVEESEVASNQLSVTSYQLEQNYPNPFNPRTKISFALPEAGTVKLQIYDLLGNVVKSLVDEHRSVGHYEVIWNGRNHAGETVAAGVYLSRLTVERQNGEAPMVLTKKMMLLK